MLLLVPVVAPGLDRLVGAPRDEVVLQIGERVHGALVRVDRPRAGPAVVARRVPDLDRVVDRGRHQVVADDGERPDLVVVLRELVLERPGARVPDVDLGVVRAGDELARRRGEHEDAVPDARVQRELALEVRRGPDLDASVVRPRRELDVRVPLRARRVPAVVAGGGPRRRRRSRVPDREILRTNENPRGGVRREGASCW
mmetsp:Transcript_17724/g.71152  ORF Transcript_17724/g.71152 Transcript_17724/m.71152 type:complete len:200 (+) Transcript_17724:1385-1984(+)